MRGNHLIFKNVRTAARVLHEVSLGRARDSLEKRFVSEISQDARLFPWKLRRLRSWTIAAEYFSFFAFMEE